MSGVETWLHSIIAVILFAVIVELLLPNSKFLKYTRLVIGLILLITMMSPIIKLFESDYLEQIDASYVMWEQQLEGAEQSTFSLRDIQSKAEDIAQKREVQTLRLTELSIEKQMLEQLKQATIKNVDKVDVTLELQQTGRGYEPKLKAVTVFASVMTGEKEEDSMLDEPEAITITPVNIEVLELNPQSSQEQLTSDANRQLDEEDEQYIVTVLQRNWSLTINQISFVLVDVEKR